MVTLPSFSKLGNVRLGVDAAPQKKNKKKTCRLTRNFRSKKNKKERNERKKNSKEKWPPPKRSFVFLSNNKNRENQEKRNVIGFFFPSSLANGSFDDLTHDRIGFDVDFIVFTYDQLSYRVLPTFPGFNWVLPGFTE